MLEEYVAVLMRSSQMRMFRIEACITECVNSIHVAHFLEVFIIPYSYLLDLVGCSESVKEVQERNSSFDCSQVSYRSEVHNFLNIALSEHCKTSLTASIYVGVVAEDVQCMSGNSTCRNMEYCWKQLAGDLVHVRDHQKKSLGSSVSCGESTSSE